MAKIHDFWKRSNMNASFMYNSIVFASFCLLILGTYFSERSLLRRNAWRDSSRWIDVIGLFMQGVIVPVLQVGLIYFFLNILFPLAKGSIAIHPALAFLTNFVVIDYLYYWNHRLLHSKAVWIWHAVHHTAERMDVWVTSRNTLWSPFFILYIWVNGFFIFILKDPAPFLLAASLTAALDLWRHSKFTPSDGSMFRKLLAIGLVTPHEHTWHHSSDHPNCNYGANLNWWDKLHGTFYSPHSLPTQCGVKLEINFWSKLLYPIKQEAK